MIWSNTSRRSMALSTHISSGRRVRWNRLRDWWFVNQQQQQQHQPPFQQSWLCLEQTAFRHLYQYRAASAAAAAAAASVIMLANERVKAIMEENIHPSTSTTGTRLSAGDSVDPLDMSRHEELHRKGSAMNGDTSNNTGSKAERTPKASTLTRTMVRRMRVDDMKMELSSRGLDTHGDRTTLMNRLLDSMEDDVEEEDGDYEGNSQPSSSAPSSEAEKLSNLKHNTDRPYVLRVRGYTTPSMGGAGVGLVLLDAETKEEVWDGRIYVAGDRTVFEAEYTAVLLGIDVATQVLGITNMAIQSDNDVVVRQIQGIYKVNKETLLTLLRSYESRKRQFQQSGDTDGTTGTELTIGRISTSENARANDLAQKALATRKTMNIPSDWTPQDPIEEFNRVATENGPWKDPDEPSVSFAKIDPSKVYKLQFDGGARGNPGVAGAGMVIYDDEGQEIWCGWKYHGENSTNNAAEYLGLLCGLKCAQSFGIRRLIAEGDSQLVVRQLTGEYRCREATLRYFYNATIEIAKSFDFFEIRHIPRAENSRADWLANHAMDLKKIRMVLCR